MICKYCDSYVDAGLRDDKRICDCEEGQIANRIEKETLRNEIASAKTTIRKRNLMIKQLRENNMNQRIIIARFEKEIA